MSSLGKPIEIFCSYAPEDETLCLQLEKHLSPLRRSGLLSVWYNRNLIPGTNWSEAIDEHLNRATIILLLISADFLASDYCYGVEMAYALQRHKVNEACVIPILARPVLWRGAPFAHIAPLPKNALPISRWRDREAALVEVAEGISQVIMNLKTFSSNSTGKHAPIWNIPFPRNRFFLGRDDVLADLEHHLHMNKSLAISQPQAISGLGGVGKTQLAIEYAYRAASKYQAILWTRADSHDTLTSGFVELAHLLQLSYQNAPDQAEVIAAVKRWLNQQEHWLLIFDNADDPALVVDFLPHSPSGHIVLTTRAQAVGQIAHRIEVNILDEETGALLLLRRAGLLAPDASLDQAGDTSFVLAQQICRELGALPLALDQAGAYIEETRCGLQQYLDLFHSRRAELLNLRGGTIWDHDAVATTWSLSFAAVKERSNIAADLLRFCTVLYPDAIPEELFLQGAVHLGPHLETLHADPLTYNQALAVLISYSLIQRNIHEQTLSIHRLIQATLQDAMLEQERDLWIQRAISALATVFPESTHKTWKLCERLAPHALLCIEGLHSSEHNLEFSFLSQKVARYLHERARYQEAKVLYQQALDIKEDVLGSEHLDVADILKNLADLYREQGKYEEAKVLYQRVLSIWGRTPESSHSQMAYPLHGLARVYKDQGKYEEAETLYLRSLSIWEEALGPEHPQVAYALNNLADLYREQGKYKEAETLYLRSLSIRERTLGPEHPAVAHSLGGLAILSKLQKRYEEAEMLFRRVLRIREHVFGSEHALTAYTLNNSEHPLMASPLNNLANLYYEQKKYEEAEVLYQRALSIWERTLGSEHPQVAYALYNLANLYRELGKYGDAEPLYLQALSIREKKLGLEHPHVAYPLSGLADIYKNQKKYQEAERLYRLALDIRESKLGPKHMLTRESRKEYALFLRESGRLEEALIQEGKILP